MWEAFIICNFAKAMAYSLLFSTVEGSFVLLYACETWMVSRQTEASYGIEMWFWGKVQEILWMDWKMSGVVLWKTNENCQLEKLDDMDNQGSLGVSLGKGWRGRLRNLVIAGKFNRKKRKGRPEGEYPKWPVCMA